MSELEKREDDKFLDTIVPGRNYSYYTLLHGIVNHDLYHAGQIALIKKGLGKQVSEEESLEGLEDSSIFGNDIDDYN